MEAANYPLFFIHISKTAGSSFRVAAERYFGKEHVFYDYGPKANETNPDIPLYESVAYLKGYIKGMEKAYDDWAQEQREAQEMIKNDICLQPVPDESASPVKADV